MRVAVLDSRAPFESSRAGSAPERLCAALGEHGHDAALIVIPFAASPAAAVVEQMVAARLLRLDGVDRAIGVGFPAYLVPHADRVVWLLHEHGLADDVREEGSPDTGPHATLLRHVRGVVVAADRAHLASATRVHARSAAGARRLSLVAGVDATVLHVPPGDPDAFRCDGYGEEILALGPLDAGARQEAAIRAIARAKSPARLVFAGPPREPGASRLAELVHRLGVGERVELIARDLDDDERAARLAGARAVLALDADPDSTSTIEAFLSRKPVVLVLDAGAGSSSALVVDRESGVIVRSQEELTAAIDELVEDERFAEHCGAGAQRRLHDAAISWATVVAELTR